MRRWMKEATTEHNTHVQVPTMLELVAKEVANEFSLIRYCDYVLYHAA